MSSTMEKAAAPKRKIFLVEDHQLFREGLTLLINREPDIIVCGEAENEESALAEIEKKRPDLVIVDISLEKSNGIDFIKNLRRRDPQILLLALSMHDESLYAEHALRAGANGYVMKQEANKKVREAIHRVLDGAVYLSEKMSAKMTAKHLGHLSSAPASPIETLSRRELEIFQMTGQGYSIRQIAAELQLTVPTINSFRARIKQKLQLRSGNELALVTMQWVQNKKMPGGNRPVGTKQAATRTTD